MCEKNYWSTHKKKTTVKNILLDAIEENNKIWFRLTCKWNKMQSLGMKSAINQIVD